MKKTFLFLSLLSAILISSCDERELTTLNSDVTPPVLKAPSNTSLVLKEADASKVATMLTWEESDYGYDAPVEYTVLVDAAGNEFADAIELVKSTNDTVNISVEKLNSTLLLMGGLDGVAKQIEVKVVAVIKNTTIETLTSNTVTLSVTPYEVVIIYPHLNLPGSYTTYDGTSWSGSGTPYSRIYSLKFDNKYEGYVYMVNGGSPANAVEFKFTKVNWGDGEYSYSGTPGTLVSGGGGNIPLASGGYYKVNADLNALTYSVMKINTFAIIGGATGDASWSTEIPMVYDQASNKWTLTANLVAGEFKFRANSGWDLNYGDDGGDFKLEPGGSNIAIGASGNYTLTLDLVGPVYRYKVVKN